MLALAFEADKLQHAGQVYVTFQDHTRARLAGWFLAGTPLMLVCSSFFKHMPEGGASELFVNGAHLDQRESVGEVGLSALVGSI